jgi:pimeloyl-ACP methyl ester carboxylesterase
VSIAYQIVGEGPYDLVYSPGWVTNIEILWEWPGVATVFRRLAQRSRVVLYDKQGTGLSDRVATLPSLEARMDDIEAVMDAAGMERAALLGPTQGAAVSALFAATQPERVIAFLPYGTFARTMKAPDWPFGAEPDELSDWEMHLTADEWGTEEWAAHFCVDWGGEALRNDPAFLRWLARMMRFSATPTAAAAFNDAFNETDVRHVLPTIAAPTLLLHRANQGEREEIEATAAMIPLARVEELPADHWSPYLGDRRWKKLAERHHATVRAFLARFRGTEIDTAGDGFFASFDGPARAVRCAQAIVEAMERLGLAVRAGVHTGEVEVIDGRLGGIGVLVGARVGAAAAPSEILVSQTVKDLTAGSGLELEDTGEHELKGVPDRWRLYRVVN